MKQTPPPSSLHYPQHDRVTPQEWMRVERIPYDDPRPLLAQVGWRTWLTGIVVVLGFLALAPYVMAWLS